MFRKVETAAERFDRVNRQALKRREEAARCEADLDQLIRRSIELYGP